MPVRDDDQNALGDLFENGRSVEGAEFQSAEPESAQLEQQIYDAAEIRDHIPDVQLGWLDEKYLSDTDVAIRFSVSRTTVWRWAKTKNGFPAPIQFSLGTTRWRRSDLIRYEARLTSNVPLRTNKSKPASRGRHAQ